MFYEKGVQLLEHLFFRVSLGSTTLHYSELGLGRMGHASAEVFRLGRLDQLPVLAPYVH